VAALRDVVADARAAGGDIGGEAALARYQRGRDLDVRLRSTAVHGLNSSLLANFLGVDLLRGAGLLALANIGPLRRALMRESVLPSLGVPRLMRAVSRGGRGRAAPSDRSRDPAARSRSD
jgi:2-octaprenyl-6-methoxyphenol hydroxylase